MKIRSGMAARVIVAVGSLGLLVAPAFSQVPNAPGYDGGAIAGTPAAIQATSTANGKPLKVPEVATLCASGSDLVVCGNPGGSPGTGAAAQQVQGTGSANAAPIGNPNVVAGVDAGNVTRRVLVGLGGGIVVGDAILGNTMRVDNIGAHVFSKGGGSVATAQVSVGTTSTLVVAARTGRQKVIFTVGAANTCAVGNSGVTLTTGFPLQPVAGATITIDSAAALYWVCNATTTIGTLEQF